MDFNSILISALIGGLSVGGCVLIAGVISKLFPEGQRKTVSMIGLFVGIGVMTFANGLYREHRAGDQIEAVLNEGGFLGAELFKVTQAGFPEEYAVFLQKARKARNTEDSRRIGAEFTSGLRRKYSDKFRASAPAEIRDLFEDDRELTKLVLDRKGWEACNAYLGAGGSALVELGGPFADRLERNGLRLFEVLAAAKDKSPLRPAPSEDDWTKFFEYWQSNGASQEDLSLFAAPDLEREETCQIYISFYDNLSQFGGDAGDRLRTEVVVLKAKS